VSLETGLVAKADFLGKTVHFRIELPVSKKLSDRLMLPEDQFLELFEAAP
jgi:hypothetical protein